jgi:hypothetical protein
MGFLDGAKIRPIELDLNSDGATARRDGREQHHDRGPGHDNVH